MLQVGGGCLRDKIVEVFCGSPKKMAFDVVGDLALRGRLLVQVSILLVWEKNLIIS